VGRLIGKVDTRLLIMVGLLLTAWAMYDMTGWNPNVSQWTIAVTGFIQGAGLGFLFVPLNTVTFATLAPEQRADGTGLFNLSRNVGSSVGISVVSYLLIRNQQINHATISGHVTAVNHAFNGNVLHAWGPWTASGRAALDQVIQMQAAIISYIDDFKLMMILSLAAMPLVLLLRSAPIADANDHAMVME
jgi:DHA2 family multidrug resistance protein